MDSIDSINFSLRRTSTSNVPLLLFGSSNGSSRSLEFFIVENMQHIPRVRCRRKEFLQDNDWNITGIFSSCSDAAIRREIFEQGGDTGTEITRSSLEVITKELISGEARGSRGEIRNRFTGKQIRARVHALLKQVVARRNGRINVSSSLGNMPDCSRIPRQRIMKKIIASERTNGGTKPRLRTAQSLNCLVG